MAVLLYKAFVIICVNAGLVQCLSESISVVYRAANGKDLEDLKKIQQKVEVAASALCLIFPSSSPFLFSFFSYFCLGQFTEYYRVVWVERDLKDQVHTFLMCAGWPHEIGLPRALNTSRDGASTTSLKSFQEVSSNNYLSS